MIHAVTVAFLLGPPVAAFIVLRREGYRLGKALMGAALLWALAMVCLIGSYAVLRHVGTVEPVYVLFFGICLFAGSFALARS